MKNGSMFGTLKNVLTEKWQKNEEDKTIILVTEKGLNKYEVFSVYSINPEDYYIKTDFNSNNEYSSFLKTIKDRSTYNFTTNVSTNDKIITLSSCTNNGLKRVVLHAKLIN